MSVGCRAIADRCRRNAQYRWSSVSMVLSWLHGMRGAGAAPAASYFHLHVSRRLHVGTVALAERELHAELRIEARKLVQAGVLLVGAGAGANVERDAVLMP